jgi:hypothetical protein
MMEPGPTASSGTRLAGPIFITGLSGTGKTELRRTLERHPELWMTRKSDVWAVARRSAEQRRAAELAESVARRTGHRRWGLQQKGLERNATTLLATLPDARVVHLVRDPAAALSGRGAGRRGWTMAQWVSSVASAVSHSTEHPGRYRVVACESFAVDAPRALAAVCTFLDVPVTPEMEAALEEIDWTDFASAGSAVGGALERFARPERQMFEYRCVAASRWWTARDLVDVMTYLAGRAWATTTRRWRP